MKDLLVRVAAVVAGIYLGLGIQAAQLQSIEAISIVPPGAGGASANGISGASLVSADGRFAVFLSDATDLTTNQVDGSRVQAYIRDITNRVTRLVSVGVDGRSEANGHVVLGDISADGRYVVFASEASNLVTNDANGLSDVFVRDMLMGVTTLVSVNRAGAGSGNDSSENPSITPDGRFVVFESDATNLTEGASQALRDIFVRDLQNGITIHASTDLKGPQEARGESSSPVISDNGRYVAFVNSATEYLLNMISASSDVFIRDIELGQTVWASAQLTNLAENLAPFATYTPLLSNDGRILVYVANTTRNGMTKTNGLLVRYDRENNESVLINRGLFTPADEDIDENFAPSMSNDGRRIAFCGPAAALPAFPPQGIYMWDADSDNIELISSAPDGGASLPPLPLDEALMSADGRYLVFSGVATNLVTNNVSGEDFQIFLRDIDAKTTRLISRNEAGEGSKRGGVLFPSISADGSVITFNTVNSDLVARDYNNADDVFLWNAETDTVELVSVRLDAAVTVTAAGASTLDRNSMSADGRFVLFSSYAENIDERTASGVRQLYVRDLTTGTNMLVSASFDNLEGGNQISFDGTISANSRFAVFTSKADNLVTTDTNESSDVFVRDLHLGTTLLVSTAVDGTNSAGGVSGAPSISRDGRYIAFESTGSNLVANFSRRSPGPHIYVRDVQEGTTVLASPSYLGSNMASGHHSYSPAISPDGRFVVFRSEAIDLLEPTREFVGPVNWYVRDLVAQKTTPLYIAAVLERGMNRNRRASFNELGNVVVVDDCVQQPASGSPSSRILGVVLHDLATGASSVLCTNCQAPMLSASGRFLASEKIPTRPVDPVSILLTDIREGHSTVISRSYSANGHAFSNSFSPIISGNGRYVVYESRANNLLPNDTNGFTDVFLYDQVANQTLILSKSRFGDGSSQKLSTDPSISADGTVIAFQSFSDDLVEWDANQDSDVFVARISADSAIDSDGDMIIDEWETTYFKTLDRDGTGDFDGDGINDWQEWKTGTLPNDAQSIFRVTASVSLLTGEVTLSWHSAPRRRYAVQYSNNLTGVWASLGGTVDASGATTIMVDSNINRGEQRFYRVMLLE